MKSVKGSTASETRMIKAIQRTMSSEEDGLMGVLTTLDIAVDKRADCFPLTLQTAQGHPIIVGKDIVAWSPKRALSQFKNSMLGSFTYPRASKPCSILVSGGETLCGSACHAFNGKPESVLYRLNDSMIGIKRCMYSSELPAGIKWAVGGMGLLDMYSPASEGFSGAYSDVLRKTNHNVLAVKKGMIYGVYFKNMTAQAINDYCKKTFKFDHALLLDGGGLAAINGDENFAKINVSCRQGYAIQFK